MNNLFILDGKKTIPCDNLFQWGRWFDKADRVVAKDQCGNAKVSTVFLGVDYDFTGKKPLLFETMVFGGPYDGEEQRYSTWEEAEEGHKKVVSRLRGPNA